MQIDLQAAVAKLTAKPPKYKDGVEIHGPVVQVVLEVEGTGQIGEVAQFLGQDCVVKLQTYQMHFDELKAERHEKSLAEQVADELDGTVIEGNGVRATISRSTHIAQTR